MKERLLHTDPPRHIQRSGHQMVEVAVSRGRQLQRSEAYVIPKIARNHYRAPTSNELLKEKKR